MLNLLLLLLAVACFSAVAAWLADNPGSVTIHWFDYRIDTSFAFLIAAAIAAALFLSVFLILLRMFVMVPRRISRRRQFRHMRRGLSELTYGVAALAAADMQSAESHTKKASKYLGEAPLALLLSAQIARSRGDDTATRLLLDKMLEHKETEYMAARYLSETAAKQHMLPRALELAERAQKLNPRDASSIASVVSLHIKLRQWQDAYRAIRQGARKGAYERRIDMRRQLGLVHLTQGKSLLNSDPENALPHARAARKLMPGFAPAASFAVETSKALGKSERRIRKFKEAASMHEGIKWKCRLCGQATPNWDAHCPACNAFDTLE